MLTSGPPVPFLARACRAVSCYHTLMNNGQTYTGSAATLTSSGAFYNASELDLTDLRAKASPRRLRVDIERHFDGFSPSIQEIRLRRGRTGPHREAAVRTPGGGTIDRHSHGLVTGSRTT